MNPICSACVERGWKPFHDRLLATERNAVIVLSLSFLDYRTASFGNKEIAGIAGFHPEVPALGKVKPGSSPVLVDSLGSCFLLVPASSCCLRAPSTGSSRWGSSDSSTILWGGRSYLFGLMPNMDEHR